MSIELQTRGRDVVAELAAITAKGANLAAGDTERFEALLSEAEGIKAALERGKKAAAFSDWATQSQPILPLTAGGTRKVGEVRLEGYERAGTAYVDHLTPAQLKAEIAKGYGEGVAQLPPDKMAIISANEYREAFKAYTRLGERIVHAKGDAYKVLQEGIDTEGGYLVPEDILTRVIGKAPTPTRVAARVTQMPTGRDSVVIPKINYQTDDIYTTGMRVTWTGEIPASSTASRVTDPIFGQLRIPVYTALMSLAITRDMVEDSAFPIVSYISAKFAETIDILRDNMALNGTGINQPSGILLNPGALDQPAVVNSGSAATLTADGLKSLAFTLPEQYDDNAGFVFSKTSAGLTIAEMKDAEGRYLWSSGANDNGLATSWKNRPLIGYETVLSALMPAVAANAFPVIFGDLTGYYLVNRVGFSIEVLRELYAETNQILVLGRVRFGGLVAEPWKLKVQKCSV